MSYLLICIAIGVFSACVQNYYCKNLFQVISDNMVYQIICYLVALIGTLLIVKVERPAGFVVFLSVCVGVLITVECYSLLEAMRCGSMSLTTLFSMAALLIPAVASPLFFGEEISVFQISGTGLVLLSMFLTLDVPGELRARKEKKEAGFSLRWLFFAVTAFFTGGFCAIVEKCLVRSPYAEQSNTYAVMSFGVLILLTAGILWFRRQKMGERVTMKLGPKLLLPLVIIGIGQAGNFILIIEALKRLPSSMVYGINNGARLILITVLDVLLFRQQLKKIQIAGMAVGAASLVLLCI